MKHHISYIIMMGDSLSDRGTLDRRKLFGLLPMDFLTALRKYSPRGRFTNGFAWSDLLSARFAEQMLIHELKHDGLDLLNASVEHDSTYISDSIIDHNHHRTGRLPRQDPSDIADALIAKDYHMQRQVEAIYTLDNDLFVKYEGRDFVRNYDEGGLTAHNWHGPSLNRFFQRNLASTLSEKRTNLLRYDAAHKVSEEDKEKTLVIEWSGANDLILANQHPSEEAAELAVEARKMNVEVLIREGGYRHFILFNLPDLSLTPRYQAMSEALNQSAQHCSNYFNAKLDEACQELTELYPDCHIERFDVNALFSHVYENPEAYGFDPDKRHLPYIHSPDFILNKKERTSPATGYMFWDDVHPTADMHAVLSDYFYQKMMPEYRILPQQSPHSQQALEIDDYALRTAFIIEYKKMLEYDSSSYITGRFKRSNINYREAGLVDILRHALDEGGARSLKVIQKLGWVDQTGLLIMKSPALENAMAALEKERIWIKSHATACY